MSDPNRLLTSSNVDSAVLELVESLRGIVPEAGASQATWPAMAAKVAALPVVLGSPSVASPAPVFAGASKLVALKLIGVAVTSTVVGAGVLWMRPKPHTDKLSARVAPSVAVAVAAPNSELQGATPDSRPPTAVPEKAGTSSAVSSVPRSSRLDAEASLLAKVRSELRSGDPHAALVTLNQLQTSFPNGGLMQEREVLSVEVLSANGNLAAAQRKASAFIAAHPTSPYSAKLQRFAQAE